MFQISPLSYNSEFFPRKPSPLAPLNPNACPRFSVRMASAGQINSDTSKNSYKRATHNPLLQRQSSGEQDRRRQAFLKKVRQVSDDKKWESRSEQILRKDFLSRQKEWELDQARSAPEAPEALEDDEREAVSSSMAEVEMVDQILSQEIEEFETLVSSMQDNADRENHHEQKKMSDYGSDEEEYDHLFMEVISRPATVEKSMDRLGYGALEHDQEMDISLG